MAVSFSELFKKWRLLLVVSLASAIMNTKYYQSYIFNNVSDLVHQWISNQLYFNNQFLKTHPNQTLAAVEHCKNTGNFRRL